MKTNSLVDILSKNNLSITKPRQAILNIFLNSKVAIKNSDIEKKIKNIDRITVYRTLQTFFRKGIIHIIPTSDDSIKFALCKGICDEHVHNDDHVHFSCNLCKKTFCLDNIKYPKIILPKKFKAKNFQILANGTCDNCITK